MAVSNFKAVKYKLETVFRWTVIIISVKSKKVGTRDSFSRISL